MIYNLNGIEYNLIIQRKNIKNIYLRVSKNLDIVITCNNKVKDEFINKFLQEKSGWLIKTIQKQNIKNDILNIDIINNNLYLLGEKINLHYEKSKNNTLLVKEGSIYINSSSIKNAQLLLNNYFVELLKKFTLEDKNINQFLIDYNIKNKIDVSFKSLKGKWGYCIPSQNKIVMNTKLIHYPKICFEYVLIHEFAHIVEANHSKNFYNIILRYMPNYKSVCKILKGEV